MIKKIFTPLIRFLYTFLYIYKFLVMRKKVLRIHKEKDVLSKDGIDFVSSFWGVLHTALHLKDLIPNDTQTSNENLEKLSFALIMRYLGVVGRDLESVGLAKLLTRPETERYENTMVYLIKIKPKYYQEAYNSLIYLIKSFIYLTVVSIIIYLTTIFFI